MHEGRLYDYVIDVDVSDQGPPLKLAFNGDEDPRDVAEAFLIKEGLPASYREQIVEFIRRNMAVSFNSSRPVTGGFCDPFTGGQGGGGGGGGGSKSLAHIPATKYLAFDSPPNYEGVKRKVSEFDLFITSDASISNLALGLNGNNVSEISQSLETLLKKLPESVSPSGLRTSFTSTDQALLEKLLSWPPAFVFPGIDATRAMVLDPGAAKILAASPLALTLAISRVDPGSDVDQKVAGVNQQLALKVASNCFKNLETREWVTGLPVRSKLFESCASCCSFGSSKAAKLSKASLLFNMAIFFKGSTSIDEVIAEARVQVFSALLELLGCSVGPGQEEMNEVAYTGLVALGTILFENKELISLARDVGVNEVIKKIYEDPSSKKTSGNKILEAAIELTKIIKA